MQKTEWDFSHLLKDETDATLAANEEEVRKAVDDFVKKWKGRTDYLENSDALKEALDDYERWMRFYGTSGKAGFYFWLKRYKKQDDAQVNAGFNKLDELSKRTMNDIQFFELNIGKIDAKTQAKFLSDARLEKYRHFLEKIFLRSKHML